MSESRTVLASRSLNAFSIDSSTLSRIALSPLLPDNWSPAPIHDHQQEPGRVADQEGSMRVMGG
eukprot:2611340-Rhodomonas_salina.1